ncbi:hypothetical protein [Streptomyces griseorubiginosus]|uniref:hypothetical protein n=1 Tax=Streptomyces griseorubiginosus TaxID=67304 RepID=UPI000B13972A|nr:hypothetical protein [Streptomyces griseorubiginosus]
MLRRLQLQVAWFCCELTLLVFRDVQGVYRGVINVRALTAWCFINSCGADAVMKAVSGDPAGAAASSVEDCVGRFAYDAATVMLFTSSFALALAAHNITSRYMFNLGDPRCRPGGPA